MPFTRSTNMLSVVGPKNKEMPTNQCCLDPDITHDANRLQVNKPPRPSAYIRLSSSTYAVAFRDWLCIHRSLVLRWSVSLGIVRCDKIIGAYQTINDDDVQEFNSSVHRQVTACGCPILEPSNVFKTQIYNTTHSIT